MMRSWLSFEMGVSPEPAAVHGGTHHALMACLLPYRPADKTVGWAREKPGEFFVRIGHGPSASPEIYSGDRDYLISAGGVSRGIRSRIVARPIVLLLNDGATELEQVVHLAGPGAHYAKWNNTGVHRRFACAAGPVHIPKGWAPACSDAVWRVYALGEDLHLAVHSTREMGVIVIVRDLSAEHVLGSVSRANRDAAALRGGFQWPSGPRLRYDPCAARDIWVIEAAGDEPLDRAFDGWPRMSGSLPTGPP